MSIHGTFLGVDGLDPQDPIAVYPAQAKVSRIANVSRARRSFPRPCAARQLGVQGFPVQLGSKVGIDSSTNVQGGTLGGSPEFEGPAEGPRIDTTLGIDRQRGQLSCEVNQAPEGGNR